MSHGHIKIVCNCGAIISQCRCMSKDKPIQIAVCDKCRKKPGNFISTVRGWFKK